MSVKALEVIHYPPDGSEWQREIVRDPDAAILAVSIRRLDRDEWPYVWLHTAEPVGGEMTDNSLCVMGGRGEYNVCLWKDGDEIHYLDPTRSGPAVRVWESGQGSVLPVKNLCNDQSLVLRIAAHFAGNGALHRSVQWEKW